MISCGYHVHMETNSTYHKAIKVGHREWVCNGITIRCAKDARSMKMRYSFTIPDAYLVDRHPMLTTRIYRVTLDSCVAEINQNFSK